MSVNTDSSAVTPPAATRSRFVAWPLWATAAGALGLVATIFTDTRAGEPKNLDYTVTVADMAPLEHTGFRIGGIVGYLAVVCLIIFAAVWRRRVEQRFTWSLGASVVTAGVIASAGALTLAYGWKGALGTYLHGANEEGTYDDQGLYIYYVMNDFSPYLSWLGVLVAGGGLAWMAFGEGLVSKVLGGFAVVASVGTLAAVAITGVPGLPFTGALGMFVAGIWLAVGRSTITQEEQL